MSHSFWFYLRNIFINPVRAARAMLDESRLMNITLIAFLIGVLSYVIIVLLGYNTLGWAAFPYQQYYPNYFTPYWWEVFVTLLWGAVIGLGYAIPCYFLGKWLGGKANFRQVLAFVMLASVVSLPIFLAVDAYTVIFEPEMIHAFAKYGPTGITPDMYRSTLWRIIHTSYSAVTMGWQGIVTLIGLTILHKNKWYANIPGIIAGSLIFTVFALLIRDHVALIL